MPDMSWRHGSHEMVISDVKPHPAKTRLRLLMSSLDRLGRRRLG